MIVSGVVAKVESMSVCLELVTSMSAMCSTVLLYGTTVFLVSSVQSDTDTISSPEASPGNTNKLFMLNMNIKPLIDCIKFLIP